MTTTRRLRQRWNDDELIAVLDLHLNHGLNDAHDHDAIARSLGRYSPDTHSHRDGPVNQKLAELMGLLNTARARRHPGARIIALLDKYEGHLGRLRSDAKEAWARILLQHNGVIPPEVQRLL